MPPLVIVSGVVENEQALHQRSGDVTACRYGGEEGQHFQPTGEVAQELSTPRRREDGDPVERTA